MSSARRARVLEHLYAAGESQVEADRLGQVCAEVTEVTGAGLMLMTGDFPRGSVATTDAVSTLIEDLQFELGEGPCVDAFRNDRPVLEPDLANPKVPPLDRVHPAGRRRRGASGLRVPPPGRCGAPRSHEPVLR